MSGAPARVWATFPYQFINWGCVDEGMWFRERPGDDETEEHNRPVRYVEESRADALEQSLHEMRDHLWRLGQTSVPEYDRSTEALRAYAEGRDVEE